MNVLAFAPEAAHRAAHIIISVVVVVDCLAPRVDCIASRADLSTWLEVVPRKTHRVVLRPSGSL